MQGRSRSMSLDDPSPDTLRLARAGSGMVWAVVFYVSGFVLVQLIVWLMRPLTSDRLLLSALPLFLASLPLNLLLPRPPDVGRWSGIGVHFDRQALSQAAAGLLLSAAAAALVVGAQLALGVVRIAPATTDSGFVVAEGGVLAIAGYFAVAAAGEELAFRGYGFQQLARALTPPGAAVATALFFGFVHGSNPAVTELALANTVLFGLIFGFALVWSRSWWLPFGLHLGWNVTLAFLGARISGITMRVTGREVLVMERGIWSGGDYGPEGSLPATLLAVALAVALWRLRQDRPGKLVWSDANEARSAAGEGG